MKDVVLTFNVTKYRGAEVVTCEPIVSYGSSFNGPWYSALGGYVDSWTQGTLTTDGTKLSNITLKGVAGEGTYYKWNIQCTCTNCPAPYFKVAPYDWVFRAMWT